VDKRRRRDRRRKGDNGHRKRISPVRDAQT